MRALYLSVRGNTGWIDERYKTIQTRYISNAKNTILGVTLKSEPTKWKVKASDAKMTMIAIMDSIISLISNLYFLTL